MFTWQPTHWRQYTSWLLVGPLSLLLLVAMPPCRDLLAAGSTQLPAIDLTSADYALNLVGGATSEDGLSCCHSTRIRQDVMKPATVVLKDRSSQPDTLVLAGPVSLQRIVKLARDSQQSYNAPTPSLPLYLRFKQLLI